VADGEKVGVKAWKVLGGAGLRVWLDYEACHPSWNDTRGLAD
jgi:hypothetical protein